MPLLQQPLQGGGQLWGLVGLSVRGVKAVKCEAIDWHHRHILSGAAMGRNRTIQKYNLLTCVIITEKNNMMCWGTFSTGKTNIQLTAACGPLDEQMGAVKYLLFCLVAIFVGLATPDSVAHLPRCMSGIDLCLGRSSLETCFYSAHLYKSKVQLYLCGHTQS